MAVGSPLTAAIPNTTKWPILMWQSNLVINIQHNADVMILPDSIARTGFDEPPMTIVDPSYDMQRLPICESLSLHIEFQFQTQPSTTADDEPYVAKQNRQQHVFHAGLKLEGG